MIRTQTEQVADIRESMRGGDGTVTVNHIWNVETELRAPQRLFARLVLPPGASIGMHEHLDEEEVYYILSGTAETTDHGKTVILQAGDASLTQHGESHTVRNIGNEPLEILAVVTRYGKND